MKLAQYAVCMIRWSFARGLNASIYCASLIFVWAPAASAMDFDFSLIAEAGSDANLPFSQLYSSPSISDTGQVGFFAFPRAADPSLGIYIGMGSEQSLQDYTVAAQGSESGMFDLRSADVGEFSRETLAFTGVNRSTGSRAIFRHENGAVGSVVEDNSIYLPGPPSINAAGQTAYGTSMGLPDGADSGLAIGQSGARTVRLLAAGGLNPSYPFRSIDNSPPPTIDDAGNVAFSAVRRRSDSSLADGVYLSTGGSAFEVIVEDGDTVDGQTIAFVFNRVFDRNSAGMAVVGAETDTHLHLVLSSDIGLTSVVNNGVLDRTPGSFSSFNGLALSENGDLAFGGKQYTTEGFAADALFYMASGETEPTRVIGYQDALFGSTVSGIEFDRYGLNDSGQLAFRANLADGRRVIALAAEPRPHRWTNPVNGVFADGSKWDVGSPPGSGDTAIFDQAGTYTVSLDRDTLQGASEVQAGEVTWDLNGYDYQGTNLRVDQPASLSIVNSGGIVVSAAVVNSPVFGDIVALDSPLPAGILDLDEPLEVLGKIRLSGVNTWVSVPRFVVDNPQAVSFLQRAEATITNEAFMEIGELVVGNDGLGSLEVLLGARLEAGQVVVGDGDFGTFAITGHETEATVAGQFIVGNGGEGQLRVVDGAKLIHNGTLMEIGDNFGVGGVVSVYGYASTGPGSRVLDDDFAPIPARLDVGSMRIGTAGSGNLAVDTGGSVQIRDHTDATWKIRPGSQVKIGGFQLDPNWIASDEAKIELGTSSTLEITIGDNGFFGAAATMTVDVGGDVTATKVIVGKENQPGTLTITGDAVGPTLTSGSMRIARELNLGPHGEVDILQGGSLVIGSINDVLNQLPAGYSTADKLTVLQSGELYGNGVIRVNATQNLDGVWAFQGSVISPEGNSPGTLRIEADLNMLPGSILEIDVHGPNPGEYDVLEVTGDTVIDGDVVLRFTDGFAPSAGDRFEFLSVAGKAEIGGFSLATRNLLPGFEFELVATGSGFEMLALNDARAIPEPTALSLVIIHGFALMVWKRKRHCPPRCGHV